MRNNDLRIGNFVNYLGDNYQVVEIGLIGILGTSKEGQFSSKIDNPHLQPIELTEEWLLKFGAIKCDAPEEQGYFLGKYRIFANSLGQINFYFFDFGDWYQHIETVNQLQNLYFALSNEELQIK